MPIRTKAQPYFNGWKSRKWRGNMLTSIAASLIFYWLIDQIRSEEIKADLGLMWVLVLVGQWTVGHPLWNILQKKIVSTQNPPSPSSPLAEIVVDDSDDEDVPL